MVCVTHTTFAVVPLCSPQPEQPYVVVLGVHVNPCCVHWKQGTGFSHCKSVWEKQALRESLGQLGALGSKGFSLVLGAVCPITAAWSR